MSSPLIKAQELEKLFSISLNDFGADVTIAVALESAFENRSAGDCLIVLVFGRTCEFPCEDTNNLYHLPVSVDNSDFREQLWERLSLLRQLGFNAIKQYRVF